MTSKRSTSSLDAAETGNIIPSTFFSKIRFLTALLFSLSVLLVINKLNPFPCVTASMADTLRIKNAFEKASLLPASITRPIVNVLPFTRLLARLFG